MWLLKVDQARLSIEAVVFRKSADIVCASP